MKPSSFLRYVVIPAAMLAAGVKIGLKYAQDNYVSKDRRFIEAEISKREKQKNG